MQILILWLGTIGLSYVFDTIFFMQIFKEIAEYGYYIDDTKLDKVNTELKKYVDETNDAVKKIKRFIPIINVMDSFMLILGKEEILSEIDTMKIVKEMTEEEKKKYKENPTIRTLFKIMHDNNKNNLLSCEYKDDYGQGKIYYKEDKETKELIIKVVEGRALALNEEEKKELAQKNIDRLNEIAEGLSEGTIKVSDLKNLSYIEEDYVQKKAIYLMYVRQLDIEEEIKRRENEQGHIKIKKNKN